MSQVVSTSKVVKSEASVTTTATVTSSKVLPGKVARQTLPPPLAVTQQQATNTQTQPVAHQLTPQQQVHQQMLQQVRI